MDQQVLIRLQADIGDANAKLAAVTEQMRRMGTVTEDTARRQRTLATGFTSLGQITGAQRFVLQNTANQLGDLAVQIGAGTSAARALSLQLPQLLGGFGALGGTLGLVAPLLGTVAAIGIPLGVAFLAMGDHADKAADQVQTFEQRLSAAQSALARVEKAMLAASVGGVEDLRQKYHEVTVEITAMADALEQIAVHQAGQKIGEQVDAIFPDLQGRPAQIRQAVADYERLARRLQEVQDQLAAPALLPQDRFDALDSERRQLEAQLSQLGLIREQIDRIGDSLNLLPKEAGGLVLALADAREAIQANDFDGAARALAAMREYARNVGITFGEEVLQNITAAEDVAAQMAARLKEAESNAGGVAGEAGRIKAPIGAAADEAARLSGNLRQAMLHLADVTADLAKAERVAAARSAAVSAAGGDPVKNAGALAGVSFNEDSGAAAYELARSGNTGSLQQLAELRARTVALAEREARDQAEAATLAQAFRGVGSRGGGGGGSSTAADRASFAALQKEAEAALGALDAAVGGIQEKVHAGLVSTADGQQAVADATRKTADEIAGLIPKMEAANKTGGPDAAAAIELWRAAVQQLLPVAENVAGKIGKALSGAAEQGLADWIAGTSEAGDAFAAMAQGIKKQIADILAQRFTERFITPLIDSFLGLFGGAPAAAPVVAHALGGVPAPAVPAARFALGGVPTAPDGVTPAPAARFALGGAPAALPDIRVQAPAARFALGGVPAAPAAAAVPAFRMPQPADILGPEVVARFARGGLPPLGRYADSIVDRPTRFAMGDGQVGEMGEAGPEAILPLRRGPGGALGVMAQTAGAAAAPRITVNVQNNAPGVAARVEDRGGEGMDRVIGIVLDQVRGALAGDISRGAGPLPAALQASFGLTRRGR